MEQSKFLKLTALSAGDYQAYLYDCDGTLADNMPAHTATYVETALEYGVTIEPGLITELAGWPITDVVKEINVRYKTNLDPMAFRERKAEIYADKFIGNIMPIDFVVAHLKASAGKVLIGVVSGGDRHAIEQTLKVLGIAGLVDVLVCAGDTTKGKPYPDPFLKAAEQLGVDPGKCMVFEDGAPGVQSATAAGMNSIRIDLIT